MGAQAPQWLLTSFVDAMQQIGATATETDLEHEGADLMQRWNAPNRQLHNVRRLMNTLTHIDEIASSAHDPDILRVAAWYYGAFLNKALEIKLGGFQANFAATRCIDHAHNRLTNLGVADEVVARIDELIAFVTRHRAPRSDFDAQVLVDADLAGLACSPQDYKKIRTLPPVDNPAPLLPSTSHAQSHGNVSAFLRSFRCSQFERLGFRRRA